MFVGAATFLQVGNDEQAYASWTPEPRTLSEDEIDAVAPECRRQLRGGSLDLERARLALAERRGEFVVLLYRTDNPDVSGKCLASNPVGSDDVDMIGAGITGSSGPTQKAPPRALVEGGFSQFGDASVTDGSVGPDVTGVTVRAGKFTVEASVQNGWYAAWWPGPAFDTEKPPASGRWDPKTIVHYDLTLSDGTVLRDVQPTRPS
ncbi:hypothetical protein GCM10020369_11160 [Cryptosporangium minutisporangium]|uniref:Uncharacterized protein n=1 Tax=Cryptosporangium minutisporangium TaxID=113569 RepID=A0ABP6SSZ8_9ACTN